MKNITIIFLVLIIVIMFGCKDNSVEPIPRPTNYEPLIPLSVGNYWLYLGYTLNHDDGSELFPDLWKFGFTIQRLPQKLSKILDTTNYVMNLCGENLTLIDDSKIEEYGGNKIIYQNQNGIYYKGIIRKDTLAATYHDLIFPHTIEVGQSVKGHVFYYSNSGNWGNVPDDVITDYTCVSTDSLFTTPVGDFRCIVYKMSWTDFPPLFRDEVYYFIKPGLGIVGMVLMVYHYSNNTYWYFMKFVLTDYKIK